MILAVVNAIYAIAKKAWEKTHDFNGISIRDLARYRWDALPN